MMRSKAGMGLICMSSLAILALPAHSYPVNILSKWTESAGEVVCYILDKRNNRDTSKTLFASNAVKYQDVESMLRDKTFITELKYAPLEVIINALYFVENAQQITQYAADKKLTNGESFYLLTSDVFSRCPYDLLPEDRSVVKKALPIMRQKHCRKNC